MYARLPNKKNKTLHYQSGINSAPLLRSMMKYKEFKYLKSLYFIYFLKNLDLDKIYTHYYKLGTKIHELTIQEFPEELDDSQPLIKKGFDLTFNALNERKKWLESDLSKPNIKFTSYNCDKKNCRIQYQNRSQINYPIFKIKINNQDLEDDVQYLEEATYTEDNVLVPYVGEFKFRNPNNLTTINSIELRLYDPFSDSDISFQLDKKISKNPIIGNLTKINDDKYFYEAFRFTREFYHQFMGGFKKGHNRLSTRAIVSIEELADLENNTIKVKNTAGRKKVLINLLNSSYQWINLQKLVINLNKLDNQDKEYFISIKQTTPGEEYPKLIFEQKKIINNQGILEINIDQLIHFKHLKNLGDPGITYFSIDLLGNSAEQLTSNDFNMILKWTRFNSEGSIPLRIVRGKVLESFTTGFF